MKIQEEVKRDEDLKYLDNLKDNEWVKANADIRGYTLISNSGNNIGEVTNLVVDIKKHIARFIEVKTPSLQKSNKVEPLDKETTTRDETFSLIPVGMIKVNPKRKYVEIDDEIAKAVSTMPSQKRDNKSEDDLQSLVLRSHQDFSPVNLEGKVGERMFDKGFIKGRKSYDNKYFAIHSFTNRN